MSRNDLCPPAAPLFGGRDAVGPRCDSIRPRGLPDWTLWYTYSGAVRVTHANGTFISGAGEAVLLAPHVPHDYATAPGQRGWGRSWVVFQARRDWSDWLRWP